GGTHAFQYDANDNRTRKTVSGAITHFNNASTSNRLNTLSGALSQSRSYDNNGNTTSIGAEVLTYSDANRLAAYRPTAGGAQTSYTYNGLGERVYKSRSGFNQRFVYGGGARLLHERGSQGTKDYIYLNGELIAFVYNNTVHYVHNDHLATPQVVTTTAGNIRWRATAKPFGDASISPSAVTLNVRYPGQYFDSESGLHYNYFRYYEPESGRYVTSDPIGLAGGLNTYAYAGGNPVSWVDPFGLERAGINQDITVRDFGSGRASREQMRDRMIMDAGLACNIADFIPVLGDIKGIVEAIQDPTLVNVTAAIIGIAGPLGDAAGKGLKRVPNGGASEGTKVYRVWGDQSGPNGRSWTTADPKTVDNYRDASGLPNQNSGRFVSEGTLRNTDGVTRREALPLDGNRGGLDEVIIPDPQNQVDLSRVSGVNPEF
ncbi:MAG: RHS repeat-associated core domain-containing protein, partial [Pseudomonadota bacterium]